MPPAAFKNSPKTVSSPIAIPPTALVHPPYIPATSANTVLAPALAMPSTAKKRKFEDRNAQKFYAVRAGVRPGIYLTWHECQAQIAGFKGAQFKSFVTREQAAAFVAGENPEGGAKDKGDPRFYAVAVGNVPGIYTDWAEASKAIVGAKRPKYKKFATQAEAADFIRMYADDTTRQALSGVAVGGGGGGSATTTTTMTMTAQGHDGHDDDEDDEDVGEDAAQMLQPAAKKTKNGSAVEDAAETLASSGYLNVYTDGSSLGNGKVGASAGIGVFFGPGDERNISERLQGMPQTNQRAELTAVLRALQSVPAAQSVRIYTDSMYAINCVSAWYRSWANNGWRTRGGDPVMNKDIIKAVRTCIDARDKVGAETLFCWVKGHSSDSGNIAADMLAVQGARQRT